MRTGILAFAFTLYLGSLPALGSPLGNTYTHHAALTAPELSVSSASFKLAKLWFLPDWQAGLASRTDTAPSGSGDRQDLTCSTYSGCSAVPANMSCAGSFRSNDAVCYKSCTCKSGYRRVSSSDICAGCVNPCDAHIAVATPYGCKTYFSDCSTKCQVAYPDNCHNRTAVSTPFGCKTYFSDCSTKCQVAYPDNCHNRTAVSTPFGCKTYFSDCSTKCQVAYPDNCHNRQDNKTDLGCDKYWGDCNSKCETGKTCSKNDCSSHGLTEKPDHMVVTECIPGCGDTTPRYKRVTCETNYVYLDGKCVSDICSEGSRVTCSGLGKEFEKVVYTDAGNTCYVCREKTCADNGGPDCSDTEECQGSGSAAVCVKTKKYINVGIACYLNKSGKTLQSVSAPCSVTGAVTGTTIGNSSWITSSSSYDAMSSGYGRMITGQYLTYSVNQTITSGGNTYKLSSFKINGYDYSGIPSPLVLTLNSQETTSILIYYNLSSSGGSTCSNPVCNGTYVYSSSSCPAGSSGAVIVPNSCGDTVNLKCYSCSSSVSLSTENCLQKCIQITNSDSTKKAHDKAACSTLCNISHSYMTCGSSSGWACAAGTAKCPSGGSGSITSAGYNGTLKLYCYRCGAGYVVCSADTTQ